MKPNEIVRVMIRKMKKWTHKNIWVIRNFKTHLEHRNVGGKILGD